MASVIMRSLGAVAVSGLLVSGCATYQPVDEAFHAALQQPYRLDAGDAIRITVFEQKELTNAYSVDKAGYIAFPLVGSVAARGRTPRKSKRILPPNCATGSSVIPMCRWKWSAIAPSS